MSRSSQHSITQWLERVQQGSDETAARKLWERYCQRLAAVAKRRLRTSGARLRAEDEADAVQEAFAAFFRRVKQGAYPDCHDRDDLWCLLVKITDNKARQLARGERRAKRGSGKVRGDSAVFGSDSTPVGGFDRIGGPAANLPLADPTVDEPDEAFVDKLVETFTLCYGSLDETERKVLRGQLQGYSHAEIAEQIGCVSRTVERKLKVIRVRWREQSIDD
jgi:RNA polymerase sigma factor (sigma-70 family)